MKIRAQRVHLQAFLAVARCGDTLEAAERLGVSETDLQDRVRALEASIGRALFTRIDTEHSLTQAGMALLPVVETSLGARSGETSRPALRSTVRPLHVLLAISVALLWGSGFVFAKAAIEQIPPILLMCFRFTVTALVLVWFVRPPSRQMMPKIFLASLVSAAIQYSFTFSGLRDLDASIAIILVHAEVPFGALLAALVFRDVLGWRRGLGMLIAFGGVALIAGEPKVSANYTPMMLCLAGAFFWAIGQIMIKKMGSLDGFAMIAWVAVFASPQLLVSSLIFENGHLEAIREANWVVWSAVIYLGVCMTALGYGIWYHLLARYDVNQVMPYLLLIPVFTVTGSVVVLGETVSSLVIVGGIISMVGVATIVIERNPARAT